MDAGIIIAIILFVIFMILMIILQILIIKRRRGVQKMMLSWRRTYFEREKTCPCCDQYDEFCILSDSAKKSSKRTKMRCKSCGTEWSIWPTEETEWTRFHDDSRRIDFHPHSPNP